MHTYVFWRLASVPAVAGNVSRLAIVGAGLVLWTGSVLGRVYGHNGTGPLAAELELLGMNWIAVLFLLFASLLAVDVLTVFGLLFSRIAPSLRGWALVAGGVMAAVALAQGARAPVVEYFEVYMDNLPKELDGTNLVAVSDLHLGAQRDEQWLDARVEQILALRPDMVVLLGDVFEGHGPPMDGMVPIMSRLADAPLGAWAVLGNHEFFGGGLYPIKLFERAGFTVLRDRWVEIRPGLVVAGVDDLTTRRRRGLDGENVTKALQGKPAGATVFLSHTPLETERAARAGADLMLSGHTHGGQVWPFDYLTRLRYPLLEGRYDVDGLIIIVSRGMGAWGPGMRLWSPGQIVQITLRARE